MNWLDGAISAFLVLSGICGACAGAAYSMGCLIAGVAGAFLIQKSGPSSLGMTAAVLSGVVLLAGALGWLMRRFFVGPTNTVFGGFLGLLVGALLFGVLWRHPTVQARASKMEAPRSSWMLLHLKKVWTWTDRETQAAQKVSHTVGQSLPQPVR